MNKERFHTSNWQKLSFKERLEALQELENEYAKQQGRTPRRVETEKMEALEYMGYYDPNKDQVKINEDHVKRDDYNYCCVETVIHEGRHAYQRDVAFNGLFHKDQNEVQQWVQNTIAYQGDDKPFFMYRLQPLERDANDYANRETNRLFEDLERKLGENFGFKEYVTVYQIDDKQLAINDAKKRYGSNYIQEIDKTIHKEYLQKRQKGRFTYKINGLEFSVEKGMSLAKGKRQEALQPSGRKSVTKRGVADLLQEVKGEIKGNRPLVLKEERRSGRGI